MNKDILLPSLQSENRADEHSRLNSRKHFDSDDQILCGKEHSALDANILSRSGCKCILNQTSRYFDVKEEQNLQDARTSCPCSIGLVAVLIGVGIDLSISC